MKTVILAGGKGTRLSEETQRIPKPMVKIGDKPILWHIMKTYSHYGFNDFIICLGYKGYLIKEYFFNYLKHNSDFTVDLRSKKLNIHHANTEPWRVTLVDTGTNSLTGGRIKRVADYIGDKPFMVTYGDGVGNINIKELVEFHRKQGKIATLTAVRPTGRFGALGLEGDNVLQFSEKTDNADKWVNGGFFVLEPKVFDYLPGDGMPFEKDPLENLAKDGELNAYKHHGFWKPMDKLYDKTQLEELWNTGNAPWKVW